MIPNSSLARETQDEQEWAIEIRPHSSPFTLNFREIWLYRDLLYLFIRRDIVAFYKQTILGPVWFFVQPLFTAAIYIIVFGQIAKLSTDGAPQILFYLSGITIWNYFSDCFTKTATVFKDNSYLFGKVYFPRFITPLSIVISNVIRFAIQFTMFSTLLVYYHAVGSVKPNFAMLLLPIVVATMALMGLSFGMLFSALTTKYRDLIFLMQFGVQLLMYATPVIYPLSVVPSRIARVLEWNPIGPLFEMTRYGFLGTGSLNAGAMIYSVVFAIVSFILSLAVFNKVERTFIDSV